jgi:hypothetical protein
MLSILPQREDTRADLNVDPAVPVYEIIVIDHADEHALVPLRNIHPLPAVRRRSGRRITLITTAAAAICAAVGFGAGIMLSDVPAPSAPAAPAALSSVPAWFASLAPVRVEPLSIAEAAGAAPQLAGWVAGSDVGGRGVKVRLLGTAGPLTTLAIELHAEPRMAMLRGVSSRAFDIEIGPVGGVVRAQDLAPPDGVAFIRRVMVHRPSGSSDGLVRVRVNLDAPGQGNLRVVGRTIYADFAAWSAVS